MAKKLFYKIGEACKQLDIQPYVLRYWETEFATLSPSKSRSGQRVYSDDDLRVIRRIKELLYDEGFTIAGAKKRLETEVAAGGPKLRTLHAVRAHEPAEPPDAPSVQGKPETVEAVSEESLAVSELESTDEEDLGDQRLREGLARALRQAREILALLGPASSPR